MNYCNFASTRKKYIEDFIKVQKLNICCNLKFSFSLVKIFMQPNKIHMDILNTNIKSKN